MTPEPTQAQLDHILATIRRLEGTRGAQWRDILRECASLGEITVEEGLNLLMDKGLVFEPTLGILRSV